MTRTARKLQPDKVEPGLVYHITEFRRRVGWGTHAMRAARRNGLRVIYMGGRAYVRGNDFLEYVDRLANEQSANPIAG